MGTRRWTLSTFVGCCIWILQGLRAATAVPVTAEGPFTLGTASPTAAETEWPRALETGAAGRSAAEADAETTESILVRSLVRPSFPPGAETGALVTATTSYGSTIPTLTNVTKPLNTSQDDEKGLAAPTAATTAASIATQHPAVTPEAERDLTGPAPDAPLGTTPLFADVKEDVLTDVTRKEADIDPTVGDVIFPSTPSQAMTWEAQPTAGTPMGAAVTVLLSQGLATATGGDKEGVSLPADILSEENTSSSHPSPGAERLIITQQDDGSPEPLGEITGAAKERPLASVSGDAGDAVNGASSTADASYLLPESVTISGTVENPGESSLLPGQAELSPAALLTSASGGDGQGAPAMSSGTPGSASLLAVSEAPAATGDKATSVLAPEVPTDAQGDMNSPALDTVLPTGYTGAVDLAAPWQNPTREQPHLLSASLPFPTDTSSSFGAAYPRSGTGASTLPAADNGREVPGSPDLAVAPGASMSPSAGGPQPWGTAAAAPQGAEGPGTGLNSVLDVPSPASFIPDGLSWPNNGVPAQGTEGAGDMALSGGPEDGSPYADTQSDMSASDISAQKDMINTGGMPAGGTGALANDELSPPSALGEGAGAASALGQISPPGPAPPGSAGLEPDLLGAEGDLLGPGESPAASGVAHPAPGAAAETPVSPDLSTAKGGPVPLSLAGPEPWGMAAGAPQGAGLPGANRPGSGLTSAWDEPSLASHGPAGPPSPVLGDQLGTNPAQPAEEGLGASRTEQELGGVGSAAGFDPSLSAAAGGAMAAGMDQLPGAGSSSLPASPSDPVAASSVSAGNGAGPIQAASPGSDSLSPASPESETHPELVSVQGTENTGETAQAGNPESENPYVEMNPSEFSAQQDTTNTGGMSAGQTGALANAELSPPTALGDGAGEAPALGQISPPGPAPPGSAGLEPDLLGGEGPGESPAASGVAHPAPGAAAETPVSPDLSAAQGGPVPLSLVGPEPWGMAAGAPQGAGLPGANRPGSGLTSAWDEPSLASHGPAGPPSPVLGDQLGANPAQPAEEGLGASRTEQELGGVGSAAGFDPSLSAAAGGAMAAGMDQLPGAGSSSLPASPSDPVATSSVSAGNGAGPIQAASPGSDSLSPASPESETHPELVPAQGTESTGEMAQAGNPESENPYVETNPSEFSAQQDTTNTGGMSAGQTGALANAELSPPTALGDGAGEAPALGQHQGLQQRHQ
ncbi:collagen alpha-1(I) chain-like [Phaenicophaeus curvirostris]|uniref:collagen alpha-1(I) chain-like n=1 Tax=Phaenicophaeus curvirostris TaxID=33595 RepID=UPI0037F0AD69